VEISLVFSTDFSKKDAKKKVLKRLTSQLQIKMDRKKVAPFQWKMRNFLSKRENIK
jgi:hypothetical protein